MARYEVGSIEDFKRMSYMQGKKPLYVKPPAHKAIKIPTGPFKVLHLDCFFLPVTKEGYKAALIIICAFNKWVEVFLLKRVNS